MSTCETTVVPYEKRATKHFPAGRPVLPEWTRYAWASMDERGWWEPYMRQATIAWSEIERWSVADGVRSAAWLNVPPEDVPRLMKWADDHHVVMQLRDRVGVTGPYLSTVRPLQPGDPWHYRALFVHADHVAQAPRRLTDAALGELLGYPACCRAFFQETWVAGQVDSTFDQLIASPHTVEQVGPEQVFHLAESALETNLLWRWMGIRLVPHMPCSCACAESIALGQRMRQVALAHGYIEELKAIEEVLNWPVTWSAINGIVEIVGPCLKVSSRTDWSPERRMWKRPGRYTRPDASLWSDNRFTGAAVMHAAHAPLLQALVEHVPQGARVIDLGCGNGLLVKRLKVRRPDVKIGGVDADAAAIEHAKANLAPGAWRVGRLQDLDWPDSDVLLVSLQHVIDMPADERASTVAALADRTLVVYGYDDCIALSGSLPTMCATVGLPVPTILSADPSAQVGLIRGTR